MKRERSLREALAARVRVLETTLQPATASGYRYTVRSFIGYLGASLTFAVNPQKQRISGLSGA